MGAATVTAVISIIVGFLETIPRLISLGIDVAERSRQLVALLKKIQEEKREPTVEEWEAMHTLCRVEEERLQSDTDDMQQVS